MGKKVSIILPTFNRDYLIEKAIKNCLSQSYENIEIVIVNDGSTDDTHKILQRYVLHPKVKYIYQENKGLPAALNLGVEKATGDYITWTSDDNEYYTDAIEKMVKVLNTCQSPSFVYANMITKDLDTNEIKLVDLGCTNRAYLGNFIGACFLYDRQIVEQIGGYALNLRLVEDYDYWIRIYEQFEMIHIPETLYIYALHSTSLSTLKKEEVQTMFEKVYEKHNVYEKVLNELELHSDTRPIYIWGTGSFGKRLYTNLCFKRHLEIKGFIDSFVRNKKEYIDGVEVFSPEILTKDAIKPYVLIASTYRAVIEKELKELGYTVDKDYY